MSDAPSEQPDTDEDLDGPSDADAESTVEDEDEESASPQPNCFFCGERPNEKAYQIWVHSHEKRLEGYATVPRCGRCEALHTRHVWIAAAGLLLLMVSGVMWKVFEPGPLKWLFIVLALAGVGVMLGAEKFWKWWLPRHYPDRVPERAHDFPWIRQRLEEGYQLGRFVEKLPELPGQPSTPAAGAPALPQELPKLPPKPPE